MKLITRSKIYSGICGVMAMVAITSCTPDDEELKLGSKAEAEFTVTDISTDEMRNTYLLESSTEGGFIYKWDLGNGVTKTGTKADTAYYEEKGTYTITLTVGSAGGQTVAHQEVTVEQDASTGVNVVQGSDMEDESAWTFYGTGSTLTSYEFVDGALKFTNEGTAQTNIGMWQAVELKGGTDYQFSAVVKGSGMTNSWMEVVILDEEPVDGTDYSEDRITGLHTWTGCGVEAFDGKLPALSCIGDGKISITEDGTYYIFIKVGSWDGNLGTAGLTIDDVELVGGESNPLVEGDNILQGSEMDDESAWTVSNVGLELTTVEFVDGAVKFTNGTESVQTNVGVWQSVDVDADQIYKFDATVNDPGSSGSWIEFYVHATEPADGADYTEGKVAPGDLLTFDESGTVYVMIKVGSWDGNLGADGVTVDDVRLVEMNQ